MSSLWTDVSHPKLGGIFCTSIFQCFFQKFDLFWDIMRLEVKNLRVIYQSIPDTNTYFQPPTPLPGNKDKAHTVPRTQRRQLSQKQLYIYWWWRPIDLE